MIRSKRRCHDDCWGRGCSDERLQMRADFTLCKYKQSASRCIHTRQANQHRHCSRKMRHVCCCRDQMTKQHRPFASIGHLIRPNPCQINPQRTCMKLAELLDLQFVLLQRCKGQETCTQTSRHDRADRQCCDVY